MVAINSNNQAATAALLKDQLSNLKDGFNKIPSIDASIESKVHLRNQQKDFSL
jgi:hypothetical protein